MCKNQKIKCNVCSCAYNNELTNACNLKEIKVCYCPGCENGNSKDESMCDSYKCKC